MKKVIYVFLVLLFISTSFFAQEKIGNKIYLYGDIVNSINGKTLIQYLEKDKKTRGKHYNRLAENKIVSLFEKKGINSISYIELFLPGSGNYLNTNSSKKKKFKENNVKTLIYITANNCPPYSQWKTSTLSDGKTDFYENCGTSGSANGKLRLLFEIFSENDEFSTPLAIIDVKTNNNWGKESYYRGKNAIKAVKKVLKSMKKEKAFE